jgi:Skp family chaperone for outer membrane proteins
MKLKNFFCVLTLVSLLLMGIVGVCLSLAVPASAEKQVNVGVVDIEKVMKDWSKFERYSQQLEAQRMAYSVLYEKASPNMTDAEKSEMQYQIGKIFDHSKGILMEVLTNDMGKAAQKIALKKNIDIVLVKQSVHGVGTDITDDVLNLLK